MNWYAALVILAMVTAAGMVIYLPFFIWFRLRAKMSNGYNTRWLKITKFGALFYAAVVLVLFGGLAYGVFLPHSWFGSQVRTFFGGIGYAAVLCLFAGFLERGLSKRGIVLAYREAGHTEEPGSGASLPSEPHL